MMVLQVRDQEVPEAREARRALDRANHAMVKIFVCKHTYAYYLVLGESEANLHRLPQGPEALRVLQCAALAK